MKLVILRINKVVQHLSQQLRRRLDGALRPDADLAQRRHIFVRVHADLPGHPAEAVLVRVLRQHLPADDLTQLLAVHRQIHGKVDQSRVAVVNALALPVALFAPPASLCGAAGVLDAEIREVIAV